MLNQEKQEVLREQATTNSYQRGNSVMNPDGDFYTNHNRKINQSI